MDQRSELPFPVVGLGASAGGLAALTTFFEALPPSPGAAFVVVLHLSPSHESHSAAILQRATSLAVTQVTGDTKLQGNHVYVIPPGHSLTMTDGKLCLGENERLRGRPIVIDMFFRTLAMAHGPRAFAVVLSGTGADGAVGIADIKGQGGVVLAQHPDDAEYEGMPSSAIATGQVDIVLPAAQLGPKVVDLWANAQKIELPDAAPDDLPARLTTAPEAAEQALIEVMAHLQAVTYHDFRHYKRATILRRIERRLQVLGLSAIPAYVKYLEGHPEELPTLLGDLLIGVTNFFRDSEAFAALDQTVVPALFEAAPREEQLRVWVPGCSTGEEAYSIAMLMTQAAQKQKARRTVQVFATDIDLPALAKAREGVYPEAIVTDVGLPLLRRYFIKEGLNCRVIKPLRDTILFAPHNLLRDPPFSRLDLISCRNLLIYLQRDVQREILQMFHFALRPGGYLFLGSSETAEAVGHLFTPIDKKNRLYRANSSVRATRVLPRFPLGSDMLPRLIDPPPLAPASQRLPRIEDLHNQLLQEFSPPSVVIDHNGDILHVSRAAQFLRFNAGVPTQHLMTVIQGELRPALRSVLFELDQGRSPATSGPVRLQMGDHVRGVALVARSIAHRDWPEHLRLVFFIEGEDYAGAPPPADGEAAVDPVVAHLEAELARTETQLQRSIEQYELAVEDLKASNEELQAINEELRSATEELETSKEELQSTNEELITVNHELKTKVDETAATNDDLQNLITSTGIATIFLERDLRIKRFTPPAADLFNIIATDVGRSLMDITHKLDYPHLEEDAGASFTSLQTVEREITSHDGRVFLVRILPYRTAEHRIDGAVLTFVDVTALRRAQHSSNMDRERMLLIAQSMPEFAIMTMDEQGRFTSWSSGAQALFGWTEPEVLGQSCALIFTPEDRASGEHELEMRKALQTGRADDERWHQRKDGSRFYVSGVMTSMRLGKLQGFAKIARDMTHAKQAEYTQHEQVATALDTAARASAYNDMKDEFLAVMSHELKHPLNLIQVSAQMLMVMPEVQGLQRVKKAALSIQSSVKSQARIIDDLLDLSRTRSGKLVLSVAPVFMREAMHGSFEWAAREAAKKKIALKLRIDDTPIAVDADAVRLEQIAMNLLSNALKFTPSGGRIDVSLSAEGGMAVLRVSDSGRGIDPDFLPHVFGLFRQAESHTARQEGGLGIGLALVRELVLLHGGEVTAASPGPGQGSTFTVRLPLREASDFSPLDAQDEPSSLAGLRVLLVEDDAEALDMFGSLLELEGAHVTSASSGEQALSLADAAAFDLIVSDVGMPGMDGYRLIQELRKRPHVAAVPAIALTGYGREQDIEKALSSGFTSHLRKPVDLADLKDAVVRLGVRRSDR